MLEHEERPALPYFATEEGAYDGSLAADFEAALAEEGLGDLAKASAPESCCCIRRFWVLQVASSINWAHVLRESVIIRKVGTCPSWCCKSHRLVGGSCGSVSSKVDIERREIDS